MNKTNASTEQQRVRVKICGITNEADALTAAYAGADAIGLVFYDPSPRAVSIETARQIQKVLPPFVTVVGLFVDAQPAMIENTLNQVKLDVLQFHGEETAEECRRFELPYIKAIRMQSGVNVEQLVEQYCDAVALLLDTYVKDKQGGTGKSFDWSLIPANISKPIILAGGLKPANVKHAIQAVKPYAVDVSGGVEMDKGVKDPDKISAFIREVNDARR